MEDVEVIFNSALEGQFRRENIEFEAKFRGLVELRGEDQSDSQQAFLSHLLTRYFSAYAKAFAFFFLNVFSKNLVHDCNSNPISAWHGMSSKNVESVCWYGLLNLSATDPGIVIVLALSLLF